MMFEGIPWVVMFIVLGILIVIRIYVGRRKGGG